MRARLWSTHSPSHYIYIPRMKKESLYKVNALHYATLQLQRIRTGLKESMCEMELSGWEPRQKASYAQQSSCEQVWGTWMKPFHSLADVGRDVVVPCDGSKNGPTNNSFRSQTQSSPSSFSHSHATPSGVLSRTRARHCPGWQSLQGKETSNCFPFFFFSSWDNFAHSSTGVTEV